MNITWDEVFKLLQQYRIENVYYSNNAFYYLLIFSDGSGRFVVETQLDRYTEEHETIFEFANAQEAFEAFKIALGYKKITKVEWVR